MISQLVINKYKIRGKRKCAYHSRSNSFSTLVTRDEYLIIYRRERRTPDGIPQYSGMEAFDPITGRYQYYEVCHCGE